jgi:hypothetical protein
VPRVDKMDKCWWIIDDCKHACKKRKYDAAKLLLQYHPAVGSSQDVTSSDDREDSITEAFEWACSHGHLEIAQWLEQNAPCLNASRLPKLAFYKACGNGHLHVAEWLWSFPHDEPFLDTWPLHAACMSGHLHVAKWLRHVAPGMRVNGQEERAFWWACSSGHLQIAKWLWRVAPRLKTSDQRQSALLLAYANGHLETSKWLVSNCRVIPRHGHGLWTFYIEQVLLRRLIQLVLMRNRFVSHIRRTLCCNGQ